ncbi:hypothetical protein C8R47DRAFT_1282499 [Mycena vitilis]|nr:hypothetical protein C8R47DRAFT_1282499 [Mycena vitilis]
MSTEHDPSLSPASGVQGYLFFKTEFHYSPVTPLTGGTGNYAFRLHLLAPYKGQSTLVMKHARPYVAVNKAIPFAIERQVPSPIVIDWELAKPGVPALDVGQFCAEMLTVTLFKPAAVESSHGLVAAFLEAYRAHSGVLTLHFANVAAKHMGAASFFSFASSTPQCAPDETSDNRDCTTASEDSSADVGDDEEIKVLEDMHFVRLMAAGDMIVKAYLKWRERADLKEDGADFAAIREEHEKVLKKFGEKDDVYYLMQWRDEASQEDRNAHRTY